MKLEVIDTAKTTAQRRLPPWLKRPLPFGSFTHTRQIVSESGVATVCQDARCPNLSECWSRGTATFMIMGHDCTRRCTFCAVNTARPQPLEQDEPLRLARAVRDMALKHAVITAVARDDLDDDGAGHFAACVTRIRELAPRTTIEVLPADFHARREWIGKLVDAGPDIYNHNIETVERLSPRVRPQAKYQRSLNVLQTVKDLCPAMPTKSGVMVGLGEGKGELLDTFRDLRAAGVDILTVGQYLQPSLSHHAGVAKFYTPEEFQELADEAYQIGFRFVACGPFVRSSYNAGAVFDALARTAGRRRLD